MEALYAQGREAAEALLAPDAELGVHEAAAFGRVGRLRALLDAEPGLVETWSEDGFTPLHLACFAGGAETVALLVERGAPLETMSRHEQIHVRPLGTAAFARDVESARALLDAGADPNAEPWLGDALYHSVEAESPECLRLLLEHGAEPRGSNALAHALDEPRDEHVRLLLEHGADPNEGALLVHAVRRGRPPEVLRLLAEAGVELDGRGGEWSTPRELYKTAYQNAVLRGYDDHVRVLEELGASTEVSAEDRAVGAVARGERPDTPIPDEFSPDAQEVLILRALWGDLELVVSLVGASFFGQVGGGPPGTLLHHAAWVGNPAIVARLLELGADPVAPSGAEFDTPIAWAALGSQAWREPGRDYVRVVELLLGAGAELEPRFAEVAEGPLAEWLGPRGRSET
jgi:hypothetical protein